MLSVWIAARQVGISSLIAPVALFPPGITHVVVPVLLPEPRLVVRDELVPPQPFRRLPEVASGHDHPDRPAVLRLDRAAVVGPRDERLVAHEIGERKVRRVA